ncbi:MAG: thiamine-phosphate kinase [Halobacteria archaeon]
MTTPDRLLLPHLLRALTPAGREVLAGAGEDDCAVVQWPGSRDLLVLKTDMVHASADFPPGTTPLQMGWMASAVNLSDLAAKGARPLYLLMAVGLPKLDRKFARQLARGMDLCARRYGARIVGGDLDRTDEVAITGFAVGRARRWVGRSGARPGDLVGATGPLGVAESVLLHLKGRRPLPGRLARKGLLEPTPRVWDGLRLAPRVSAMTDVSDSLALSLHDTARASGVGFRLDPGAIPVDPAVRAAARLGADPLDLALYGGGDFGLLFTYPPRAERALRRSVRFHRLGVATRRRGVFLGNEPIRERGYSHF